MWLDFRRGQYPKICGGKNSGQKKKPTGCSRFDPLFWSKNNPLFGFLLVTNIVQYSVFVESMFMFQKPVVYTPDVLVNLDHILQSWCRCRVLRWCFSIDVLLLKDFLGVDSGTRVCPLYPFPTAHPAGVFFRREERYNRVFCLI